MKSRRSISLTLAIIAVIAVIASSCYPPAPVQPVAPTPEAAGALVYQGAVYFAPGGDQLVVTEGGEIEVQSGAELNVDGDTTLANLEVTGGVTGTNVLTTGNQTVGGIKTLTTSLGFEGATANEFEVYLASADATADVTATLPIASGTIMLSSLATNAPAAANSVTGGSNALIFEGSAADANETTVSATNPTAARSVVLANASGTVMLSTLATNAPEVANSVTGISNGLAFEGATGGDGFQTILVPVDTTTADKTITLPNVTGTAHVDEATQPLIASTGTFATDVTLTPAAANGNGALKSELSGLPRSQVRRCRRRHECGAVGLVHGRLTHR